MLAIIDPPQRQALALTQRIMRKSDQFVQSLVTGLFELSRRGGIAPLVRSKSSL
jgi:hypothetical protein